MKCSECDGVGYKKISATSCAICERCGGTGEIAQTNEEWLRNLSFNDFARVLYCMIINGERIRPDLAYIKKWLKEKHDE